MTDEHGPITEVDLLRWAESLAGIARITFLSQSDMETLLTPHWALVSAQRLELSERAGTGVPSLHAEWRIVAERLDTDVSRP